MDENKRNKLKNLKYSIQECCGLCMHGEFPNNNWGTCNIHTYDHLKHSDSKRHLSIHKFGVCENFVPQEETGLGAFEEFYQRE